jgi:hypothetical protein
VNKLLHTLKRSLLEEGEKRVPSNRQGTRNLQTARLENTCCPFWQNLIMRFLIAFWITLLLPCFVHRVFSEDTAQTAGKYETPGPVNAEDFLPKSAFAGKRLFVEKTAANDGLQNSYRVRAGTEAYEVTGSEAALELLQELKAIRQLRQISTAKAVTRGLKESAKGTYETGREIVRDPIAAVKKVPQGASRFFGKVKEAFNQDEEDAGSPSGGVIKGFLGVDEAKRKLAAQLGVDVYSRNEALQKELDRVASAIAGGGLAFNIGTMPIGGAVGVGLTAIGIEQTVDSLINQSSPEDLRKWNEQNLAKSGATADLIAQFLGHPWYSPRQETIITAALGKLHVDPNLFVEMADKALTDQDGRYFERVAQLLAAYAERVAPLQSLRVENGVLCALDRDGVLVVPVSFDYAIWTNTLAQRVDALAALAHNDQAIKRAQIWTDGKISPLVTAELGKRLIGFQSLSLVKNP